MKPEDKQFLVASVSWTTSFLFERTKKEKRGAPTQKFFLNKKNVFKGQN